MQGGLRLRQSDDSNYQHLNQDIKRHVEDPEDMLKVQDTRWNQARHEEKDPSACWLHAPDWSGGDPPGAPDYWVANPSKEASRRHQIDPVAAVRKAPDYALVLFTNGVFHSPD